MDDDDIDGDDDMMLVENIDINDIQDRNALGFGRGNDIGGQSDDFEDEQMYVKP